MPRSYFVPRARVGWRRFIAGGSMAGGSSAGNRAAGIRNLNLVIVKKKLRAARF
jgi:hypothetical protein